MAVDIFLEETLRVTDALQVRLDLRDASYLYALHVRLDLLDGARDVCRLSRKHGRGSNRDLRRVGHARLRAPQRDQTPLHGVVRRRGHAQLDRGRARRRGSDGWSMAA